jgi:hypothetical protein
MRFDFENSDLVLRPWDAGRPSRDSHAVLQSGMNHHSGAIHALVPNLNQLLVITPQSLFNSSLSG